MAIERSKIVIIGAGHVGSAILNSLLGMNLAREIVLIAVMCALCIASRGALAFLPHIKPIFGLILISGAVFGWETGFLVGAISAFGSNFFFGQGPWTPWQMVAYGTVGMFGGLMGKNLNALMLALLGFFVTMLVAGPLMDLSRLFTTAAVYTKTAVISTFAMGVPVNLLNGAGTFVTVLLLKKPLVERLQRVREKYGLI
jgi:uncharacterized membrane protein